MLNKLTAGTFFTSGWCYSIDSWLEHFLASIDGHAGTLIVSTDSSQECSEKFFNIKSRVERRSWDCIHIKSENIKDNNEAYKDDAQLIIARIQQKAFSIARDLGSNYFWSIESDILVPPNSLKVLLQSLEFDDFYYDISMITYPNGSFLGGRGTPQNNICEDFDDDERILSDEIKEKIKKQKEDIEKLKNQKERPSKDQEGEWAKLRAEIKKCPPKDNIFALQAKGWKKRGWLESAYPAIGRGAILPTDWVGLGCTMLNKKALSLATYEGYDLKGTQDLFLCWKKWNPAGIKMCVIPHILCSHVKRKVDENGFRTNEVDIQKAYHELGGEFDGHLRWSLHKYINFNA
jgi:hypothetical protein